MSTLQWGGRFSAAPDPQLLAFASSLSEDLLLAPFDVACSAAHVDALAAAGIVDASVASSLKEALEIVAGEIAAGRFAADVPSRGFEDVHGAIDARVREVAGTAGEWFHAGRSRNDQVATTLLLYARDRAQAGARRASSIAATFTALARAELDAGTLIAGGTHRQPAQPVLLAFLLTAWSEPFVRHAARFLRIERDGEASSPLGSAALAGSSLPLDRQRAASLLGFDAPSRSAFDAIGNRDVALDLAHEFVRTTIDASRVAEELVTWSAPAFGYVRLGDAASTGSSLMPQKRNPDPFELVRARAATLAGRYAGALATLCGLAPSYHRDLQATKSETLAIVEEALRTLDAFERALNDVTFERERMTRGAVEGYTVATDVADALIARGVPARAAHALVGSAVATAEREGRPLDARDLAQLAAESGAGAFDAPLDAKASVEAKKTLGSTAPADVRRQIAEVDAELAALAGRLR